MGLFVLFAGSVASAKGDLRLVNAAKSQDVHAVQAYLRQKVDVNTSQPDGATALHWAAHWDDIQITELLIKAGANVNAVNEFGVTPLHLAATNGSGPVMHRLLAAGANPNAALGTGETPLMTAARTGNVSVVELLLDKGADVNAKEIYRGQTALMWAVAQQHMDVAKTLLRAGADVSARTRAENDGDGFTPLLFAARAGDMELVKALLAHGAKIDETSIKGNTALHVATVRGHVDLALFLLDLGADPNAVKSGFAPLHWAAGQTETLHSSKHVGIVAATGEWRNATGLVAEEKIRLVKALLKHGADPNIKLTIDSPPRFGRSSYQVILIGATPLHLAAGAGDTEVMRLLLASGADLHAPTIGAGVADNQGRDRAQFSGITPLMMAAGFGRTPGETAIPESQALAAVKLLCELGAKVNAADEVGDTALHAAAYGGETTILEYLVQRGADINASNKRGETPLQVAEQAVIIGTGVNLQHPEAAEFIKTKLGGKPGTWNVRRQ